MIAFLGTNSSSHAFLGISRSQGSHGPNSRVKSLDGLRRSYLQGGQVVQPIVMLSERDCGRVD